MRNISPQNIMSIQSMQNNIIHYPNPLFFLTFFLSYSMMTKLDLRINNATLSFDKLVQLQLRMRNHRMQTKITHETSMWELNSGIVKITNNKDDQ